MGIMGTTGTPATSPILGKRKRPPARPQIALGYVGSDPASFGGGRTPFEQAHASGLVPSQPQQMTDAQLLRPSGAAGQAYDRRLQNQAPGGMAMAGARARETASAGAALLNPWKQAPAATPGPGIEWQPDLMKQIVGQNNAVRGIAPGQAGTIDHTAPNLFSYGEQLPGGARGRYVGPGAIQPDSAGRALVAGPDLATQRRILPLQQEVAQGQTGLLQTQAAGQMASMAPALMQQQVVEQQRAEVLERMNQIAQLYPDPADKQRIAQLMEQLQTGQQIQPGWWEWLKNVLGERMLNFLKGVMGEGRGGGGGY